MNSELVYRITKDYPELKDKNLRVVEQFKASYGRDYDVYLIEIPGEGLWIAKGTSISNNSLIKEKEAIEVLLSGGVNVPKLFNRKVDPKHYLLLEYIKGTRLDEIDSLEDHNDIVVKLAKLIGDLHSTKVSGFGDFSGNQNIDWFGYISKKFDERFAASSPKLHDKLSKYIQDLWDSVKPSVQKDSVNPPVAVHRDLYLDNFILIPEGKLYLIDFGLMIGGRPMFDLGKFYILVLKNYPNMLKAFIEEYKKYAITDNKQLEFYTVLELIGMIPFFESIGNSQMVGDNIKDIKNLSKKVGALWQLIDKS